MPAGDLKVRVKASAPLRSCIGCGRRRPKRELIRLVIAASGQLAVDGTGRHGGRGAYVCAPGCLAAAARHRAIHRAFRGKAPSVDVASLELALAR
ncbi:MAG TPA: YlxR family protein [Myxococcaceae bacterium]|nr:YlxR family protein [Myxococcaceae bacterium]